MVLSVAVRAEEHPALLKREPAPSLARLTTVDVVGLVTTLLAFCVCTVIGPRQALTAPLRAGVVNASFVGPTAAVT